MAMSMVVPKSAGDFRDYHPAAVIELPFLPFRALRVPGPQWYRAMGPLWWPTLARSVANYMEWEHEIGSRAAAAIASARCAEFRSGIK